jgi:hypothetical protein
MNNFYENVLVLKGKQKIITFVIFIFAHCTISPVHLYM